MKIRSKYFKIRLMRRSRRSRIIVMGVLVLSLVFTALFTYSQIIEYKVSKFLSTSLVDIINKEYNQSYNISYDTLKIDYWSSQVVVSNVGMRWKGSKNDSLQNKDRLLKGGAIKVYLDLDGLWRLWLHDHLAINRLRVVRPEIHVIARNKKETHISAQTGDFLKVIREQLDIFEIEYLQINSATLQFYKKENRELERILTMPDVSLNISDFEWELSERLEGITTDDFSVNIKNQKLALLDSTIEIGFDELNYSLERNEIYFKNVAIHTVPSHLGLEEKDDIIDVYLPKLTLSGVDLQSAYTTNKLNLDTLKFSKPAIYWKRFGKSSTKKGGVNDLTNNRLFYGLSSLFDQLSLSNLSFREASLDFQLQKELSPQFLKVNKINLSVNDIVIDSLTKGQDSFQLRSDELSFEIFGAKSTFGVNQHDLFAGHIYYSFKEKMILLDSLNITPDQNHNNAEIHSFNIAIPKLVVNGVTHRDIINRRLDANLLQIPGAQLELTMADRLGGDSTDQSYTSIAQLVGIYFDHAVVKEIDLKSINIDFQGVDRTRLLTNKAGVDVKDLNLLNTENLLEGLSVFKTEVNELVILSPKHDLDIKSRDVKLDIKSGMLSTSSTEYREGQTSLSFERLNIDSLNVSDWYYQDTVSIQALSLDQYELDYTISNQGRPLDRYITIDSLNLSEGRFSVSLDSGSLTFNSEKILTNGLLIDKETIRMNSYMINMANADYKAAGTHLMFSMLNVESEIGSLNTQNLLYKKTDEKISTLNVPNFSLSDFDLNQVLKDGLSLKSGRLQLTSPRYLIVTPSVKDIKNKPLGIKKLLSDLPAIQLKGISITDGHYESLSFNSRVQAEDIDLKFDAVNTAEDWSEKADQFLFAKRMTGSIAQVLSDQKDSHFQVKNLQFGENNIVTGLELAFQKSGEDSVLLTTDHIEIGGLAYNEMILNNSLNLNRLIVESPVIAIAMKNESKSKNSSALPHIHIAEAQIDDASILLYTPENQKIDLDPVSITLKNIQYDSSIDLSNTLVPAQYISLSSKDLEWTSGNGLDKVKIGRVSLLHNENATILENISLKPMYGKEEYAEKVGHETDWITGEIPKVTIKGMNFRRFLQEKAIISDDIIIHEPSLEVYRNKNLPDELLPLQKPLPTALLKLLSSPVDVDSLKITNGRIAYHEIAEKGSEPGVLTLSEFNAQIKNMTNVPDKIQLDPNMRVSVQTDVMGQVDFEVDFNFHLNSEDDRFDFTGTLASNDLAVFNKVTEGTAFLKIKSGRCKKLEFSATANDRLGHGSMYFQYNNLKVALVDKQTNDTKKFEESVASFFANTLLIKKRNLALFKLRKGDIYFRRNKEKSIFNYLSKLFMSGVSSSVGFKNYRKEIRELAYTEE